MKYSLLIALIALAACDKGAAPPKGDPKAPAAPPRTAVPEKQAGTGMIVGTIKFDGTPPAMPDQKRIINDYCNARPAKERWVVVGDGGALKDVLVRLPAGVPGGAAPSQPLVIDQRECDYQPHVAGLVAGQRVRVLNSDDIIHNIQAGQTNSTQMAKGPPQEFDLPGAAGTVHPMKCSAHPWMESFLVVSDHPHFAVSGQDGAFTINNVPPGTWQLEAWHPYLGVKTVQVTVKPDEQAAATFAAYTPADYKAPAP